MISVKIHSKNNKANEIIVSGHAGFADPQRRYGNLSDVFRQCDGHDVLRPIRSGDRLWGGAASGPEPGGQAGGPMMYGRGRTRRRLE